MEADPVLEEDEGSLLKQIQTILYSTEVRKCREPLVETESMTDQSPQEGFEIPQEADGEYPAEEETF